MLVPIKLSTFLGIAGVVIGVMSAAIGYTVSREAAHEALIGHPPIIERVAAVQADVSEIKDHVNDVRDDVQELLRRSTP